MALEIYNTLTRRKEEFVPVHPGHVGLYVCGPTVYGDAHVGHAKAYIMGDIVNRYLRFQGYHVTYVQNITDVGHMTDNDDVAGEDKLLAQGRREKKHPMEIAEFYTRRYYEDMAALNVLPPDIAPRATGHVIEQIEMIKELLAKGSAYEAGGNVYFDVASDPDYGKLSGRKAEEQAASGRVEARMDKRSPNDFALWKKAEQGHILRWPSPWGEGFPGWHIECSAMARKYLGDTIDIHGAGLENMFPHNECEIAQSETANAKPFVKYWMHNNMVTTGGVKMGKSLGNSSDLRDLFNIYRPLSLRFTLLQSHYRSTTEFVSEAIRAAESGYEKLVSSFIRLQSAADKMEIEQLDRSHTFVKEFINAMDDDFSTPRALAVLYKLAAESNRAVDSNDSDNMPKYLGMWDELAGKILGILPARTPRKYPTGGISVENSTAISALMLLAIRLRKEARDRRDFAMSDTIRRELEEAGVLLEDSKEGTTWRLKS